MEYIPAKQILSRNRSTAWFGTDHTMNLYRGCCHGCIYCDSRSSCYQNPDFDRVKATDMLDSLQIDPLSRLKTLSKGNQEKVQLILTMSRKAQLYVLDEPIAGVDPAARDYILSTILSNYSEDASVLLSTHLIADVERVLDEVIFLKEGAMVLHDTVDHIREEHGKSVDALFREVFAC